MRILASDLDGTLVRLENDKLIIADKDIEAIKELRSKGNKFIVSTGRDYNSTTKLMSEYGISYDYLVMCNGALVVDSKGNEIIKSNIDYDSFKKVIDIVYENDDMRPYVNAGKVSFVIEDRTEKTEVEEWIKKVSKDELVEKDRGSLIIGMHPLCRTKERAEEVRTLIDNECGEKVEAYRNNCYVDVVAKGSSKGNSLNKVLEILGADKNDIYTIGDSYNDIPMFEITNNSYTFNSSEEAVKAKANNLVDHVYECINEMMK